MTAHSGVVGYQPEVAIRPINPEQAKYRRMYEVPDYRKTAPGESIVPFFMAQAKPKYGSHVISFGCGLGREGMELRRAGMKVTMLDFASNSLDQNVRDALCDDLKFVLHDLEDPIPFAAEYGICFDVMEHIPTARVPIVLHNILKAAQYVMFAIALHEETHGDAIGEKLHLTVQTPEWWKARLEEVGATVIYEDNGHPSDIRMATGIYMRRTYAVFYVSAWDKVDRIMDMEKVIINAEENVERNIRANVAAGYESIEPFSEQETEVMIVGGGPSLKNHEDEIRRLRSEGVKLVTLNGAYNWCLEKGIMPSATIVVDARLFNKRFVEPPIENCWYFLASQCDPSLFEGIPREQILMWHSGGEATRRLAEELKFKYWPVVGGSTVLLRAIPLLRTLGYKKFHVFGCDSCLQEGRHHSFSQPENDDQIVLTVKVTGGRMFYCNPWMAAQAHEFINLVKHMGDHFDMEVYGDGMLAHIIKTGAEMAPEGE